MVLRRRTSTQKVLVFKDTLSRAGTRLEIQRSSGYVVFAYGVGGVQCAAADGEPGGDAKESKRWASRVSCVNTHRPARDCAVKKRRVQSSENQVINTAGRTA
jgi:hypothetical protein